MLDSFTARRRALVDKVLSQRGIDDPRVLSAMRTVPREAFVDDQLHDVIYRDCAQPIGYGQTISQPFTVAFMVQAARLRPSDRILEVGTGSGYGAAVLAELGEIVHTLERLPELAASAARTLAALGYGNVHVHTGDGTLGFPDAAPYDAIVVTAGAAELPACYREQLCDGGRIVIPLGETQRRQKLFRFELRGQELSVEDLGDFAFVPLIGEHGWRAE